LQDGIAARAPAKINLNLHVTGRRPDGYHLLETIAVFAVEGAADVVTVRAAGSDRFSISGPFSPGLETGAGNLVVAARDALRVRHAFPAVEIHLQKNLPLASGIGGGSSDAAATLRALAKAFSIKPGILDEVAPGLGADVPMCLAARTLIARGIGEKLQAVALPGLDLVLVNPGITIATPDVFRALSNCNNLALPPLPDGLDRAGFIEWLTTTRNDLQLPAIALCPQIADVLIALIETGPMMARMTGSGATCFAVHASPQAARDAARSIAAAHPGWWVAAVRTGGHMEEATDGE
jgi:4-diphosphocytidyl-2-C-methyl-D-erythritol kinase